MSCTDSKFKEGDIIFQTTLNPADYCISHCTGSNKTHCGIIVEKNRKFYVLEVTRSVTLTPLDRFIEKGTLKKYWLKRAGVKEVDIKYKNYLGVPTDSLYQFDNGKFYCSELVYEIYDKQLGIQLCKPKPLESYPRFKNEEKSSYQRLDGKQYVVSPDDLFNSPYLTDMPTK